MKHLIHYICLMAFVLLASACQPGDQATAALPSTAQLQCYGIPIYGYEPISTPAP